MSRSRAAFSGAATTRQTRVSDRVGDGGFGENHLRPGEKEGGGTEGANANNVAVLAAEDGASALMLMFTIVRHDSPRANARDELA